MVIFYLSPYLVQGVLATNVFLKILETDLIVLSDSILEFFCHPVSLDQGHKLGSQKHVRANSFPVLRTEDHISFGVRPVSTFGNLINTHVEKLMACGQNLVRACCLLGPVRRKMEHICTSPLCNGFYISLGLTILKMGANATKAVLLILPTAMCLKIFRCLNDTF